MRRQSHASLLKDLLVLLGIILGTLAVLSWLLTLWQWAVAFRFPLHQTPSPSSWSPPLTLLKPLKGCDARTAECLESWLAQSYPGSVEILFGVASAQDPACQVVTELLARYPKAGARLVVCPESLGANAKVSTLIQLMRHSHHDLLVVSDADVWAPDGLLADLAAHFLRPEVGLVNCFYRLATPANLPMRWEAFAVNADFWSQVLQSESLKPLDFALGAVMATSRAQLHKLGGFAALADYLADDYELGHRVARGGAVIALSTLVVECRTAPMSGGEVWSHQLRWARTIRACQPLPYFLSQLHNPTLWPWLWACLQPGPPAFTLACGCLLTRMVVAFYCERKLTRQSNITSLGMAPVKDLLQALVWLLAFLGRKIQWRGQRFKVQRGGRLVRIG